jgi:ATP-dependent RNA circularization protein (DNA/RNA ligase family)
MVLIQGDERQKLLGRGCYGHIPHVLGSRLGSGDHHISPGQSDICTKKTRDSRDLVIISEKLDGSSVAVAMHEGLIYALTRSGYPAHTSRWPQHRWFDRWVHEREYVFDFLEEGERVCGEWLAQAHGTKYALEHIPFVPFDILRAGGRASYEEFNTRLPEIFPRPYILSMGYPMSIEEIEKKLGPYGHHGALEMAEGVIFKVERDGIFDFNAKYVRPNKKVGQYLGEDKDPIYNWMPGGGRSW